MLAIEDSPARRFLQQLGTELPKPRAIVLFSAHWLTRGVSVMTGTAPQTIHDFGGFDPALYDIKYPAAGDPASAIRVMDLLQAAEITAAPEFRRDMACCMKGVTSGWE